MNLLLRGRLQVPDGQALELGLGGRAIETEARDVADDDRHGEGEERVEEGVDRGKVLDPHGASDGGDGTDDRAGGVGAAGQHTEREEAGERTAKEGEQAHGFVPEGGGLETCNPESHRGGEDTATEGDPPAQFHAVRVYELGAQDAEKIVGGDGGHGGDGAAERAHGRGENAGDDQTDEAGWEFVGDEVADDGVVGQIGDEARGVQLVEGKEGGADEEEHGVARQAKERAHDHGAAGVAVALGGEGALHEGLVGNHREKRADTEAGDDPGGDIGEIVFPRDELEFVGGGTLADDARKPAVHAGGGIPDHEENAGEHHEDLHDIGPDDGFETAFHRVGGRDDAHHYDAKVNIQPRGGGEGEGGKHHDDAGAAEDLQDHRETGDDEADVAIKAGLEIAPMQNALNTVAKLKPVTYDWIDGGSSQGFIAHELQEIVPEAVVGEKDAVNEDGSIKAQGIDTSFLVATLTAAIKELNAKVTVLEAQLAK